MPTTVHFITNRVLSGAADSVASYTAAIQPPADLAGLVYGTAFVDGVDIASNDSGIITMLQEPRLGGFAPAAMADLSRPGRNLLLFLHGFDNSFQDAITRSAFNREWLAASGVAAADTSVIAFAWPSLGRAVGLPILQRDYQRDQLMARSSGLHLMAALSRLRPILAQARDAGARCFLLAHSMGNLALQSAVENWFLHGNDAVPVFDLSLLAAADCSFDAFEQPSPAQLQGLTRLSGRVGVYYSHVDHVLQLSAVVNGGMPRLGQDGPRHRLDPAIFPAETFRFVDATAWRDYEFNLLSSHQYYRRSPTARADIAWQMGL